MATFDAPNRDTCIVRRARTNTPLQALVTLNDPVYVEAAQALARRADREGRDDHRGEGARSRSARAWSARRPTPKSTRLVKLYDDAQAEVREGRGEGDAVRDQPARPAAEGRGRGGAAAWTVVANVLLNLDEMLMKR